MVPPDGHISSPSGKRDYGQRCQEASSWKSVRFEIPAGLLQVLRDHINEEWEEGYFTHFSVSAQQQPQGSTVEQQESSLSAHWARQTGPGVVCVQLPSTRGLQTHSASQIVLDGSACMDFLSMIDNSKVKKKPKTSSQKGRSSALGTFRTDVDVTPVVLRRSCLWVT